MDKDSRVSASATHLVVGVFGGIVEGVVGRGGTGGGEGGAGGVAAAEAEGGGEWVSGSDAVGDEECEGWGCKSKMHTVPNWYLSVLRTSEHSVPSVYTIPGTQCSVPHQCLATVWHSVPSAPPVSQNARHSSAPVLKCLTVTAIGSQI